MPPTTDPPSEAGPGADVNWAAVRRIRLVARILDESITIPGTSFGVGIDPILGLLPVAGDLVGAACSLYVVVEAARLGVSRTTLLRMLLNVAVDLGAGSVPVLGDAFDALWKANVRNVELVGRDLGIDVDGGA